MQYEGITGFVSVFVKQFRCGMIIPVLKILELEITHSQKLQCCFVCAYRKGSIITDFIVQTTQVNSDEMAAANQNLPQAMKAIVPVIGSVSAYYNSK